MEPDRLCLCVARAVLLTASLPIASLQAGDAGGDPLQEALAALRQVGPHGQGHAAAIPAWRRVAAASPERLGDILRAMDHANPLATNWLRAAADTIAERTLAGKRSLPTDTLERFLLDPSHSPRPRRLAYEWLVQVDPRLAERLLPRMLEDSSLELRREAVARVMDRAQHAEGAEAVRQYRRALLTARDLDQIDGAANALEALGQKPDLASHLGFFTHWALIGPFDNRDAKGFDVAYPPEEAVDLRATYDGKAGPVRWTLYRTDDSHGVVDGNRALGKFKGAVLYASAEFVCDDHVDAEVRWGSINATKVWWNGDLVGEYEVYHTAMAPDQYRGTVRVRKGRNRLLVKVCQNEQTESWAQRWEFQVRLTDGLGGALPGKRVARIE